MKIKFIGTLMLFIIMSMSVFAIAEENKYPESSHPYENDSNESWTYVHSSDAAYLKVLFAQETYVEDYYDFLIIKDSQDNQRSYTGNQLAGKELILPGNSFVISLVSDWYYTLYGFSIESIVGVSQEEYDEYYGKARFEIKDGILTDYSGQNEVIIPETIDGQKVREIADGVFQNRLIERVVIPDTVEKIGDNVFKNCQFLTEIELSENLKSIGNSAFENTGITRMNIPSTVKTIGRSAFKECINLEEIELSDELTSISAAVFSGCSKLEKVELKTKIESIGFSAFGYCYALKEIHICEGVTDIDEYAFASCNALENIDLPESLENIEDHAFEYCEGLRRINIPNKVSYIGDNAFEGTKLVLDVGSNTYAREYAIRHRFEYTSDLDSIVAEEINTVAEKVEWIIEQYLLTGMSEYERALTLYDWICQRVVYDYAYEGPSFEAEGALLYGKAVCEGFAKAYELLLEGAGIRAEWVGGYDAYTLEPHAWVIAQIDGEWYQFDPTWDEQGNGSFHEYFGLTDNAMEVDHYREDHLSIKCNSWKANYKYRNGEYDLGIEIIRSQIENNILNGIYEAVIEFEDYPIDYADWPDAIVFFGETESAMLIDILELGMEWSVDGWADLTRIDGDVFAYEFHLNEEPVREIQLENIDPTWFGYWDMYPGYTVQLTPITVPVGGCVSFSSTDEDIITVSQDGVVTAIDTGEAYILLNADNCISKLRIRVVPQELLWFEIYGLEENRAGLDIGEIAQIDHNAPKLLLMDKIEWSSDNESVATIDENGIVTALNYGKAIIYGKWNGMIDEYTVIVRKLVQGVDIVEDVINVTINSVDWLDVSAVLDVDDLDVYCENYGPWLQWNTNNNAVLWHYYHDGGMTESSGKFWGRYLIQQPGVAQISVYVPDGSLAEDTCLVYVHCEKVMCLPGELKTIQSEAFKGNATEEFILGEGVQFVGQRAFADCINLQIIYLPDSLLGIAEDAFEGCGDVKAIVSKGSYAEQYAIEHGMRYDILP